MLVFENKVGKVFYKKGIYQVKIKGLIGLIDCKDYSEALKLLDE